MKKTRLSEKLNNKRGASILVALVLFMVVTMTSVLVLTAVSANAGRLEQERASEAAQMYANSLVSVLNSQIKNTDMTVAYKMKDGVTESQMENNPTGCMGGTSLIKSIDTSKKTLFCASFINTSAQQMLDMKGTMGSYTSTVSYSSSDGNVAKAYNGLTATVTLNPMERSADGKTKNFSLSGYIQVYKNKKQMAIVNFNIPATVTAYSENVADWTKNGQTDMVTETGVVLVKWGRLVTY